MRRRLRRLSLALLALAALIGVAFLASKHYLASSRGGARIAARLEPLYGARVQVGGVDVGWEHVTLRDVRLFEAGTDAKPWIVIDELQTDLTAEQLLRGETTPHRLVLAGAAITLRFDRRGALLTRLPSSGGKTGLGDLQEIRVPNGQVILRQEGRPDFLITAMNATVTNTGNQLNASGTAMAGAWGEWSLAGAAIADDGAAWLTLRRPDIHFTQPMLDGLPLVPAATWKEVQLEGDTPIGLTIRYDPADERSHYRVDLHPRHGRLRVTAIDLDADSVDGEVIVEDGQVRLRDVAGHSAEGIIRTSGDLDFESTPERLKFAVDVQALRLRRLPRSWSLPPLIDGRLTGHADLVVTLDPQHTRTNGDGHGIVEDTRIAGMAANPLLLKLVARGRGFQFAPAAPDGKHGKRDRGRVGGVNPLWERPTARCTSGDSHLPLAQGDYAEADLGMNNADVAELLRGFGVTLPITGRITWHARLRMPLASIRDPKTYRIQGNADLPHLRLRDLELEDVRGRIDYRDGVLRLEELEGGVPGPTPVSGGPPEQGRLRGNLRIGLVPAGTVEGRLTAGAVSLEQLLRAFSLDEPRPSPDGRGPVHRSASGNVSGTVEFQAPLPQLRDITTWTAVGSLAGRRVRVFGWDVAAGRGSFHLGEGVLSGADLAAHVEGIPISGTGSLRLTVPYLYQARAAVRDDDPSALERLARKLEAPVAPAGAVRGTGEVKGSLRPLTISARLEVQSPRLRLQRYFADHVRAAIVYQADHLGYQLAGNLLDGRLLVEGHVRSLPDTPTSRDRPGAVGNPSSPLPGGRGSSGSVHDGLLWLKGARLARLWEMLGAPDALRPLQGAGDVEVSFRDGADHKPSALGHFALRALTWDDTELAGTLRGTATLAGNRLRLRNLVGDLGEGILRGSGGYDFGHGGHGWFNAALERVEAGRLLGAWPVLRSRLTGPLDLQVRGTLGVDWSASGEAHLPRGSLLGVEVTDARLPFRVEVTPLDGTGQIDLRDATAHAARGRLTAQASYRWSGDSRLESRLRFHGVQIQALLRSLGAETGSIGTGQLSGRLDLAGTNIHSADDLTGSFQASLQQTQAAELPVVRQLLPFLAPTQSGTAIFTAGDLELRLAGGVLRIQRFRLVGPVLQLLIEGTATLQGRLDLDATANTSGPLHSAGAKMLSASLPAVGTVPLRLLTEATALFAGRLLHLRVTGTWRSPVIHVAPVLTLTEEAVRFFVELATRGASIIRNPASF